MARGALLPASLLFCAAAAAAAPWTRLPPLDGNLSGDLSLFGPEDGVVVHWTVSTATRPTGARSLEVAAEAPGLAVKGRVDLGVGGATGEWRLEPSTLDLDAWATLLFRRYAPELETIAARGTVRLAGEGRLQSDAAMPEGEVRITMSDASLEDPVDGWSVRGLSGQLVLPRLPIVASDAGQRLTFREAALGTDLVLRNGITEVELVSSTQVKVQSLRVEAFGGWIRSEPFAYDFTEQSLRAVVHVEDIQIEALKAYFPENVLEARGRLRGELEVRWDKTTGLSFGRGNLVLEKDQPAMLRLASTPGFLSSKVPTEYDLVPWMPRWLTRWLLRMDTRTRDSLVRIEEGREHLVVESLQAELNPPGEEGLSTAKVRIVARPSTTAGAAAVKRLQLTVTVSGPLADVLRFGMDGRVSMTGAGAPE